MKWFATSITMVLFAMLAAPQQVAAVTFADGSTHALNGPAIDVYVANSTTLNIGSGASISSSAYGPAVAAFDETANHINVMGGVITGGSNPQLFGTAVGSGIRMWGGILEISGGTLSGGTATQASGNGIETRSTNITISGGTFHGGNTPGFNFAGDGALVNGGSLTISGGAFYGGNGELAGAAISLGRGPSPFSAHALITGGTFIAGSGQGIEGFDPFSINVGYSVSSSMDLKGGQFSGGFHVAAGSILNIYGYGLTSTPINSGQHVSGTLLDGTPLSVDALVRNTGTINLINVPEPGTLVLFSLGCAVVFAWNQKNRTRTLSRAFRLLPSRISCRGTVALR
jgi:hypothetical protein